MWAERDDELRGGPAEADRDRNPVSYLSVLTIFSSSYRF